MCATCMAGWMKAGTTVVLPTGCSPMVAVVTAECIQMVVAALVAECIPTVSARCTLMVVVLQGYILVVVWVVPVPEFG